MAGIELQNTVKEALNALYHHPDDAVRMQADRWLQEFQRTIDAWQVFDFKIDLFVLFLIKDSNFHSNLSSWAANGMDFGLDWISLSSAFVVWTVCLVM